MQPQMPISSVIGFYGTMVLMGGVWLFFRDQPLSHLVVLTEPATLWPQLLVGIGSGALVVWLSRGLERWFEFARSLSRNLRELLPIMSSRDIAIIAVASSVGEELFFRGAMHHAWGLWPTALVFGLVHGFFIRKYWAWMIFATVIGIAFGYMVEIMGTVLAPTLCHFTINYFNLHALCGRSRT